LKEEQNFFLNSIIKNSTKKYNFQDIADRIIKKFNSFVSECKEEAEDIFKSITFEPMGKINLIISQLRILRGKQVEIKFISFNKVT
jgi:hypothetical protein